jgi:hypothetical protein
LKEFDTDPIYAYINSKVNDLLELFFANTAEQESIQGDVSRRQSPVDEASVPRKANTNEAPGGDPVKLSQKGAMEFANLPEALRIQAEKVDTALQQLKKMADEAVRVQGDPNPDGEVIHLDASGFESVR